MWPEAKGLPGEISWDLGHRLSLLPREGRDNSRVDPRLPFTPRLTSCPPPPSAVLHPTPCFWYSLLRRVAKGSLGVRAHRGPLRLCGDHTPSLRQASPPVLCPFELSLPAGIPAPIAHWRQPRQAPWAPEANAMSVCLICPQRLLGTVGFLLT